jgi:hypothetical protein
VPGSEGRGGRLTEQRPFLTRLAAGIAGTVAALCAGVTALCFGLRQGVSHVAPGLFDSLGVGWLELVPPPEGQSTGPEFDCTLSWNRDGFTTLSYVLSCTAGREDIELSELHLAVMDAEDWTSGKWSADRTTVYTYEEQWPMDEERIRIAAGRSWSYTGTMAAGAADWLGGAPRAVAWTADVTYPESTIEAVQRRCRQDNCAIDAVSIEPPR